MTNRSEDILKAIENVSQRKHVISAKAIEAKHALDQGKLLDHQQDVDDDYSGSTFPIIEFNKGLRLVRTIIRDTRFDDFSALLNYPGKLMMIHFFLGVFRGLGFMCGVSIVAFLTFYVLGHVFPVVNHVLYSLLVS